MDQSSESNLTLVDSRRVATQRVSLVFGRDDGDTAARLEQFLAASGVIVELDSDAELDALVVLMSPSSISDPIWVAATSSITTDRVIPVNLGLKNSDGLPTLLTSLNWINSRDTGDSSVFGHVLTALFADHERRRLVRQLAHEAETWGEASQPRTLLIEDVGRAERLQELLAPENDDPSTPVPQLAREYLQVSLSESRRRRRKRRMWRGAAAVVVLIAAFVAATRMPEIDAAGRANKSALVTAGNPAVFDQMPSWTAVNSAALMLNGSKLQKQLGYATLMSALAKPWAVGDIGFVDSVMETVPFGNGKYAAVLALNSSASGIGVVDLREGRMLWSIPLPRRFERLDISEDGRIAVVAGSGIAKIDLKSRRVRMIVEQSPGARLQSNFDRIRLSGRTAIVSIPSGAIETIDLSTSSRRETGTFSKVLDIRSNQRGGGYALVQLGDNQYAIVDAATGKRIDRAKIPIDDAAGAISADGRFAVVKGSDGQLWRFGNGNPPSPTGIPAAGFVESINWFSDDRIAVVSDERRVEVFHLPSASKLGSICTEMATVLELRIDPTSDLVACYGDLQLFWKLPAGPRSQASGNVRGGTSAKAPLAQVDSNGSKIRITFGAKLGGGKTKWFEPFDGIVSAVSFNDDGSKLAAGASNGKVALMSLDDSGAQITGSWSDPSGSRISGFDWDKGAIAATEAGQTWDVPNCDSCGSPDGALKTMRSRISGCFTERQVAWISDKTRARFGIRICAPVGTITD